MDIKTVKEQLDTILQELRQQDFIASDPISIPKRFAKKEDIEISAFFAATLAWGQRKTIIANTNKLMHWMGQEPHAFITQHSATDLVVFERFVHRTFNATDVLYFIEVLKRWYLNQKSLEDYFVGPTMKDKISYFHHAFFNNEFVSERTRKHVANPAKNSSAKRLNMYLRWMVRGNTVSTIDTSQGAVPNHTKEKSGESNTTSKITTNQQDITNITTLDFGIWNSIKPAELKCPLDVHVQRAAFHFGLLTRTQQDWKAVEELSNNLLKLDAIDPIKYDLALFKWSEAKMGEQG